MIEPLEIAMRARQGVVKEFCRLADIHADCLGFLPVHETNCHRYQIGRPPREDAPRPLREVIKEPTAGHVPVVVEGQITVSHEHMIAGETALGPDPAAKKTRSGSFQRRTGSSLMPGLSRYIGGPIRGSLDRRDGPSHHRIPWRSRRATPEQTVPRPPTAAVASVA